jgi:hypothetical protein
MITKNSPERKKGNPRGIPTQLKQRTSSVARLYTNGIDVPLYGKLHKAQHPVSAETPEFSEVLKIISITPPQLLLFQRFIDKSKDSFFMLATAHVQVVATAACNLTPHKHLSR